MTDSTCVPRSTASAPTATSVPAGCYPSTTPAMTAADIAAHKFGSHVRVSPEVQRAVTRFEVAALRVVELAGLDARGMSAAQFDSLALAQDTMVEARLVLERAGLLHLIDASALAVA